MGQRAPEPSTPADGGGNPWEAVLPCVLAWVVPGAGHFYLGRRRRAVAFFAIVLITFVMGMALSGRAYVADQGHPLTYLATFANMGLGPLDLIEREATYARPLSAMPIRNVITTMPKNATARRRRPR